MKIPEPPRCTLGKRYTDPMDGCDSLLFGRYGILLNRPGDALVIPFRGDEANRFSVTVSAPESVVADAKREGASLVLLYNTDSGTVYEYDMTDFSKRPYEVEYGEERVEPQRGLRSAKYRWDTIGDSLFTIGGLSFP
jgi:hypothetical protein